MTEDPLAGQVGALQAEVRALRERLDALDPRAHDGQAERFAAFYSAFQDRFRGDEDDVRARLGVYLPDVARVGSGLPLLDVGPGRGEWLALLAERGVPAYGVEANDGQVERIRARRGLDVVPGDAIAHLEGLAPGSLDAVTAFHVIEHLAFADLLALLAAARRALRPGGLLLLETPNPSNLVMGAATFYLDPTHRRPLPAALTEFLVRASGFEDIEVRRLHPREVVDFGGLRLDGVPARESRLTAEALTTAVFGPQDYAVLAT